MVQRLLGASGHWLATLVVLGALGACASTSGERHAEATADGWRIVERVGEARHSPPGDATWRAAITGQPIMDGAEVTTGRGGRLIIAMPGRHISVGPASRFVLPRSDWDDRLEQRAGWLRYRVASSDAEPFRVRTRSLEIEFATAILDVRVDQDAVDVTVTEGKVRLATPDGLRRTEVAAGQSARASGLEGVQLAVRSAPERTFEAVEPLIIPAIQPAPDPSVAVPVTGRSPTAPAGAARDESGQRFAQAPPAPDAIRSAPADETQDPHKAAAQDESGQRVAPAPSASDAIRSAPADEAKHPHEAAAEEGSGRRVVPAPPAADPIRIAPADVAEDSHEAARSADRADRRAASTPAGPAGSGTDADQTLGVGVVETEPVATGRRGQVQRLTAGMIDGIGSTAPMRPRPTPMP
jgi:hypothetical protein